MSGPRVGEAGPKVEFGFEGRTLEGVRGEPIAAALHASGVRVLSRSFKYARPRGLHCVAGACPNCALRVDGLSGVTSCVTPLRGGEVVSREPAGGLGRLAEPGAARAIAAGAAWSSYEVDVVVIGAGPAGLAAALAAEEAEAGVLLVERDHELGGSLLCGGPGERARAGRLASEVDARAGISVRLGASAVGWYDEGKLGVAGPDGMLEVRPRAVVLASGTYERRWAFEDGDRPGVMLAHGAQRLLNRHGVLPGRRVAIATDEDYGYRLALALVEAGAEVSAVIDARPTGVADAPAGLVTQHGIRLVVGARPVCALGCPELVGVVLGDGGEVECDALLIAGGRVPALELLRQRVGGGAAIDAEGWWVAGGAGATESVAAALESGAAAGLAAARHPG